MNCVQLIERLALFASVVSLDLLLISSPPKCSPSDFQSHKQLGSSSSFPIKLLNVPASSRRSNQRKLVLGSQCS